MTNKENALKVIRHIQDTVEGLTITHWSNGGKTADVEYLEPELRHLLLAIRVSKHIAEIDTEFSELVCYAMTADKGLDGSLWFVFYDLTKSLLANLEGNPALTDYLLTLFGL